LFEQNTDPLFNVRQIQKNKRILM